MLKRALKSFAILALLNAPYGAVSATAGNDCFERNDNSRLSYAVVRVSTPPMYSREKGDYPDRSDRYPASDYTTTNVDSIKDPLPTSASGFKFNETILLWANRCIYIRQLTPDETACRNMKRYKGNGYRDALRDSSGQEIRPAFASYAKANTCTKMQTRRLLGESADDLALTAESAGLRLWDNRDRAGLRALASEVTTGDGTSRTYLVDVCVLPTGALGPDGAGVTLDYEVFDDRTSEEAVAFIDELAQLVHARGKKLTLNVNPLPRAPNGLDRSNVHRIVEIVDRFIPTLSSGASPGNPGTGVPARARRISPLDDYQNQLGVITDDGRVPLTPAARQKIVWQVSLYDTQLPEARRIHDEINAQGYGGVMIFRHFVKEGGSCTRPVNQLIACLTLGQCSGRFGTDRL